MQVEDLKAACEGADVPSATLPRASVVGARVADLVALPQLALAGSKAEARRLLKGGGVRLTGRRVEPGSGDDAPLVQATDLVGGQALVLRVGKRRQAVVFTAAA